MGKRKTRRARGRAMAQLVQRLLREEAERRAVGRALDLNNPDDLRGAGIVVAGPDAVQGPDLSRHAARR